jgi:glycosyltransferase involved in cell wall biosynthesis
MSKTIAFVGPLPPPVGGVALANIRVQQIVSENLSSHKILNYNTSKGSNNADLYKRKGIGELWHFIKNIVGVIRFAFKNKIDISNVFIVPNISFIREALFILILKITTKKLVIHLHAKTSGDYFLSGFKLKIFTKIISLGDVVFVLSEEHHRSFFKNYIDPKKLIVLENFIDKREFENNIKNKEMEFLYVGRLSEKKGFYHLVQAISMVQEQAPGLIIHVLGEFENETFKAKVLSKIESKGINAFKFYGAMTGQKKLDYFKKNSIFLFPSYFENSPIVLKEAIAAKMAIIASDIIENKNILNPFSCKLYFKAKDSADLAAQILHLYQNPDVVKEMMTASEKANIFDKQAATLVINKHLS